MRSFNVTPGYRRRWVGVHNSSAWRDHFDWLNESCTRRHFTTNKTPKHVTNCRHCDRFDSVDRTSDLWRAAGEVDDCPFTFDFYAHSNRNCAILDTIIVQRVFSFVRAVRNRRDRVSHQAGGIVDQLGRVFSSFRFTAPFDDLEQTRGASFQRSDLRVEVAATFDIAANVCE